MMPDWVPAHREVNLGSGVAELLCAAGLLYPPHAPRCRAASAAMLLVVYSANLKMAADALSTDNQRFKAAAFGRLPLQLPLIRIAWKAARAR